MVVVFGGVAEHLYTEVLPHEAPAEGKGAQLEPLKGFELSTA